MHNIQVECGQDCTSFFEDIPHSLGARNIAQKLVVLIDTRLLQNNNITAADHNCGLYVPPSTSTATQKRWLESSNTRPPASSSAEVNAKEKLMMTNLLPKKPSPATSSSSSLLSKTSLRGGRRRPNTLRRIRMEWNQKHIEISQRIDQEENASRLHRIWSRYNNGRSTRTTTAHYFEKKSNNSGSTHSPSSSSWRYYYDPFRQEWQKWNAASNLP